MIYTTLWLYALGAVLMAIQMMDTGTKCRRVAFVFGMVWPFIMTFSILSLLLPKEKTNV